MVITHVQNIGWHQAAPEQHCKEQEPCQPPLQPESLLADNIGVHGHDQQSKRCPNYGIRNGHQIGIHQLASHLKGIVVSFQGPFHREKIIPHLVDAVRTGKRYDHNEEHRQYEQ